ncbi:hypothetical protein P8C59_001517 [Phyllachora maydis]|uniref:Major facilitator superfamily (MFS) profile domain-containing protein n=1 Tax=Phyllachora maydis TaxID=1825666 RepID=A0AAD9HYJ1_9PEZI|nr:hypothetical protein P8C59_001517 [Phyllachora maydis]
MNPDHSAATRSGTHPEEKVSPGSSQTRVDEIKDKAVVDADDHLEESGSGSGSSSSTQDAHQHDIDDDDDNDDFKHEFPTGLKLAAILTSVVIAYFLVFLDLAVMSTVTPAITSQFGSLVDIGWYGSAYQLGSSAFQPLSGKIYRHFSIKSSFLVFFVVFELGSALCGAAQSSHMLIVGRAVAGLGSSGIFTGAITTVANVLPLSRRPAVMGVNVGIGQLGLALGPILGGAFTSKLSWRWVFYLNLCLGVVVGAGLLCTSIPEAHRKRPARQVLGTALRDLDLPGFALVGPAVVMLLLALEYGGNEYAWDSSVVIGLLVGFAVTFALFWAWEYRQADGAMIPLAMLRSRVIRSAALTQFFRLAVTLVADYYLAIFFQAIRDDSPLMSGVHMLPTTLGLVFATVATGIMTQVTGYYLPWIMAGSVIATAGYGAMSTLGVATPTAQWIGFQLLYGIGCGTGSSGPYIAVQNLVPLTQIPTAMATVIFGQNLGGAIFLVVGNAIFDNTLRAQLAARAAVLGVDPAVVVGVGARSVRALGLSPAALAAALDAYAAAVDRVMYLGLAAGAASLAVSWGMGNGNVREIKKLKELTTERKTAGEGARDGAAAEKGGG